MPKVGYKHSAESLQKMKDSHRQRWGPPTTRFWSRVKKQLGDICWNWLGDCYPDGYGRFWFNGDNIRANRCAWILTNGEIPEGMQVLHTCDNPKCVRPTHLFLGTHRDNIDDMLAKGRSRKGEDHIRAKLTERQVIEVLEWHRGCTERLNQMAARMGVSIVCLELIRAGRNWKHLYHLHHRFKGAGK